MILLTIAVPSYNAEDYLDRCLSSMADPRFEGRLEVVVVNDGSVDRTAEIAEGFVSRYPKIFRLISKANGGHGSAVNTGLDEAKGEYFRIVDADDWVCTDALAALLDAMETAAPDMFIDERIEFHEGDGWTEQVSLPQFARDGIMLDFDEITGMEYTRCISMHTLSASTKLLRDHGIRLLEHTYYVDMQFVIGVAAFAETVYLMRNGVYNYRLGSQQQSVNYLNYVKNYDQHDRVFKACVDFCDENLDAMPAERETYVRLMLTLLARTQYKIALIFNPNRSEGLSQARELSAYLARRQPYLSRATRGRRVVAGLMHSLGIGYDQLQRLKAVAGRG